MKREQRRKKAENVLRMRGDEWYVLLSCRL